MKNRTSMWLAWCLTVSLVAGTLPQMTEESVKAADMEQTDTITISESQTEQKVVSEQETSSGEAEESMSEEEIGSEAEESETEEEIGSEKAEESQTEETESEETELEVAESEEAEESQTEKETGSEEIEEKQTEQETAVSQEPETEDAGIAIEHKSSALRITDETGMEYILEEMIVPEEMTVENMTYPVEYEQGVYRIYVPEGTDTLQITVQDQGAEETMSITGWNGYLMEKNQHWFLHPDDPVEGAYTVQENCYQIHLQAYQLEPTEITLEQLTVYGELDETVEYAEIFVTSEERAQLLLVEMVPEHTQISLLSATEKDVTDCYKAAGKNLAQSAKQYIPTVSSINGEWQIVGLARSDAQVDQSVYDGYLKNVIAALEENNGVLHAKKYTEYSRVILALTSLGYDVTDVAGYNLLQPLADYDQTVWQGVNGAIFALIAVDSHDYEIPTAQSGKTQNSREKLIDHILSQEISGGGWDLSGKTADPDVTAMALQALAPYYKTDSEVRNAVDRGIAKLSAIQKSDGTFATYGSKTSESCAQVVVALTALGIDPNTDSRFVKNGISVLEAMLAFAQPDGSFRHVMSGASDQMATEQAYYALTAYERFTNGQTSLYDMTDVVLAADKEKAAAVEALIQALPTVVTSVYKDQIELTWNKYNALNKTQKNLLTDELVKKLQAAVDALKKLDQSWSETEQDHKSETKQTESGTQNTENTGQTTETKVVGGTTKKVNLVSSQSAGTGSTVVRSAASSGETETEEEEESEAEKYGATKRDEEVNQLLLDINALFRTTKSAERLPENAADYSEDQMESILRIYRTYLGFSAEQQEQVMQGSSYSKYLDVLAQLQEENHYDLASGTDLTDNDEEILPWYIRLEVDKKEVDAESAKRVQEAMQDKGALLTLQEINFLNLLDEEEWQPEELLRVSIPMIELGTYENVAVVHFKEDGSMEFLTAHIAGANLEFDTDGFSSFGVVGYNGSMEEFMQEQSTADIWLFVMPAGCAAVLLLLLFMLKRKNGIKKQEGENGER